MVMARADCNNGYLLPSHPMVMMEDPLSICEDYSSLTVPMWRLVTTLLSRKHISSPDVLLDVITTFQHDVKFDFLPAFLKIINSKDFFERVVPNMVKIALQMPELFPSGELKALERGRDGFVSFTRKQIACLLVHMFLCTLQPQKLNKHWVNFSPWFNSNSPPVIAYMQCLCSYFSQLDTSGCPPAPDECVTFYRRYLSNPPVWKNSDSKFLQIIPSGTLDPDISVEVVFANKDPGFGISGTQEEVKFAMSPEMCVLMMIVPTLLESETLVIQGAKKIGVYKGLGREIEFIGPCDSSSNWLLRHVIVMDALELDEKESSTIAELEQNHLTRELSKAYCGFTAMSRDTFTTIGTGHWGCGAFGGHKYAKALIQAMAAAQANTTLLFQDIQSEPKDNDFLPKFMGFLSLLMENGITVGKLFSAMCELSRVKSVNKSNLFSLLEKNLLSESR